MKRRKQIEQDASATSIKDTPTRKRGRPARVVPSNSINELESEASGQNGRADKDHREAAIIDSRHKLESAPTEAESEKESEDAKDSEGSAIEDGNEEDDRNEPMTITPAKANRGVSETTRAVSSMNGGTPTKSLLHKKFSTPSKTATHAKGIETPKIQRNANRSARKKSTRKLIESTILGQTSDNDEDEDEIAEQIYESDDDEEDELQDKQIPEVDAVESNAPVTPSRKRGRPKGAKNRPKSPTPPMDLSAHEKYFFQNRGGKPKTSNNNLSSLQLLDHEEYFSLSRTLKDSHQQALANLEAIHSDHFNQWQLELSQDFNLCLYGFGSKRCLLLKFADHVYASQEDHSRAKIVVVNGYLTTLTIRDILKTVASAVSTSVLKAVAPTDMLESVLALLEEDKSNHITLIIHSIDALPLRRPATQTILSRLSSHSQINMVASADHPNFPLLWDSSLRSSYNFCFHDCTTYQPYSAEYDVVDEVHALLGRSGRRVGGKEGVSFVLKSLPENARNLFRVLIGEQLASMDEAGPEQGDDDDDDDDDHEQRLGASKSNEPGVEYRILYQKAVEEFICSSEMNFRTLLKEFHDHQMIQSRKDVLGTEILFVPFRREELETILEDIMS